ncbi:MAG: hypothetical protein SGPRY_012516, partial [Prymnesium sp.]
ATFPIFAAAVRLRFAAAERLKKGGRGGGGGGGGGWSRADAERALRAVPNLGETSESGTLLVESVYNLKEAARRAGRIGVARGESFRSASNRLSNGGDTLWHRGRPERAWSGQVLGRVADRAQLIAKCPNGCYLRSLVLGNGGVGGSMIDETNRMAGAQLARALWHYRNRIHRAFATPPPPLRDNRREQHVTFIESRRQSRLTVGHFEEWVRAVGMLPGWRVTARAVAYEKMSFVERLAILQRTSVLVCGVGTAQESCWGLLLTDCQVMTQIIYRETYCSSTAWAAPYSFTS